MRHVKGIVAALEKEKELPLKRGKLPDFPGKMFNQESDTPCTPTEKICNAKKGGLTITKVTITEGQPESIYK